MPKARLFARGAAACLAMACVSSCKRDSPADGGTGDAAAAGKSASWPELKPRLLDKSADAVAMLAIADETPRPGLLLEGSPAKGGARNWLIVGDVPPDLKSVPVACRRGGKLVTGWAQPLAKLSSGLSLMTFMPTEALSFAPPKEIPVEGGVHAVRFGFKEPSGEEALATQKSELETLESEISGYEEQIDAARRAEFDRPPGRPMGPRREPMAATSQLQRSQMEATRRRRLLEARMKIPFKAIGASEAAAAANAQTLEAAGRKLENTVLVSDAGHVVGIRWRGQWAMLESIRQAIAEEGGKIESAEIGVASLSPESVQVSCTVKLANGIPGVNCSLVAATHNDLEQMTGGGTLEERLARVEPVAMTLSGDSLHAVKTVSCSSQVPTRLWLKVFTGKVAEPVLDEAILLTVPPGSHGVVPIWDKPPSPLIKVSPPPADVPADVVQETQSLTASGTIRDLVPAGDGSVLMVQTDREPFWAALDLKSAKWLDMPWKADAATLLASRSGKIHLVNKDTGAVETWDLAGGKRDGTKLLQVELPITAVAAPLSNPDQPLIVADAKGIRFLDPADFRPVEIDADLRDFLKPETVDRAGIWLRASGDGAIYQILGRAPNREDQTVEKMLVVDSSWRSVPFGQGRGFVSAGGRQLSQSDDPTDQAGTGLRLELKDNNERFPNRAGFISISALQRNEGTKEIARIHSQRLTAAGLMQGRSRFPLADRRIYLDSRIGVLLVPAGDKLEWARIALRDAGPILPMFAFSGETVRIPLPPGTGHRMTAASSAKVGVADGFASWTAPSSNNYESGTFTLVWTGELGSEMSRDFKIRVLIPPRPLEVVSPDDSKVLPLRPRGLLAGSSRISVMAGSGAVAIREDGSVWSLSDCQQLFKMKESGGYLGDAERTYACANGQTLTAYDLRSGQALGSMPLGENVRRIVTGMSSRNPLLAVEQLGTKGALLQIPRDLTRAAPAMPAGSAGLDPETQSRLFVPKLECNAEGSISWEKGVLISTSGGKVALKVYSYEQYQGVAGMPDATGRIIVDDSAMLNLGFNPPRQVKYAELPGGENMKGSLDESGTFLILSSVSPNGDTGIVSIREVAKPHVELLKIRYPYGSGGQPRVIASTRTLCVSDGGAVRVYDLDIPKLAAQLGARP